MNYAIIISGSTHKLDVINLSDWEVWQRDEFNTLRNNEEKNDIVLFPTKEEAIEFLLENFERELIDKQLLRDYSVPKGYVFYNGMKAMSITHHLESNDS